MKNEIEPPAKIVNINVRKNSKDWDYELVMNGANGEYFVLSLTLTSHGYMTLIQKLDTQ